MRSLPGAALVLALAVGGCASVTSGTSQTVTVTPVCEGSIRRASCELWNDKGRWQVQAPGAVAVQKSFGDLSVTCSIGAARGAASFVSKPNDNVFGNAIVGGLVGLAIDSANGAGYNYPAELPVVVFPPCGDRGS